MEKKLDVRNLRVSFRTEAGKVQAVRDISFVLEKGETLAIVGESGSGKSVTSRAILGILAGNAIVEGGEIIYDGKDLLKIEEEEFHKIRGDKIAMIFQDPMSSLNPIIKIGRQLTEAMLLKNTAFRRDAVRMLKLKISTIEKAIDEICSDEKERVEAKEIIAKFNQFRLVHAKLEGAYNEAFEAAIECKETIEEVLLQIKHNQVSDIIRDTRKIVAYSKYSLNDFVIRQDINTDFVSASAELMSLAKAAKKSTNYQGMAEKFELMINVLDKAVNAVKPNFFSIAYVQKFSEEKLNIDDIKELNKTAEERITNEFMNTFNKHVKATVLHIHKRAMSKKQEVCQVAAPNLIKFYTTQDLTAKTANEAADKLIGLVEESINRLETFRDSIAYTFKSGIKHALKVYFGAFKKNAIEEKRYAREMRKFEALKAKGKDITWVVTPASLTDIDLARNNIILIIQRLIDHYTQLIAKANSFDEDNAVSELIEYLIDKSSASVYKVTPAMAKRTALQVMEEVGIPEPVKRFNQFPFQFSGGMRQRIVIAIALIAKPDILICDEPTTALDVTIQAQILELINKLKAKKKLTVIFITHDLGVVANMADKIAVMYAGKIVEYGKPEEIFYSPAHPYTWALLASMPDLDTKEKLDPIPGTPPNMIYPPVGDAFALRSKYAMEIDFEQEPPMFNITETHRAATWLLHPDAPKTDPPKIILDRIARMKMQGGQGKNG